MNNKDTLIEKNQFLDIINATPLVSIDLILEDPQGNVLLGKRVNRPAQGYWFVPGGRIRKNERLAEALQRIAATELGTAIAFDQAQLLGAFDHLYDDNYHGVEQINTHYVALAYRVWVDGDFEVQRDTQHSAMQWWSKDQLLNDPQVHPNTQAYFG